MNPHETCSVQTLSSGKSRAWSLVELIMNPHETCSVQTLSSGKSRAWSLVGSHLLTFLSIVKHSALETQKISFPVLFPQQN
jgi:hypothetical protein